METVPKYTEQDGMDTIMEDATARLDLDSIAIDNNIKYIVKCTI
jgi:hypothetical protein